MISGKNTQNEANLVPLQGLGVIVIADDLTGAAEIAGVCLRYGLKVAFGIDSVPNTTTDVRIIATDSRSATELEAFDLHKKLAIEIYTCPDSFVFKKCDSVLRGFILTELSALMEVSDKKTVLLQPANPATERIIRQGIYYVGNELLENTGFSIDPDFPAKTSNVQLLVSQRTSHSKNTIVIISGNIQSLDEGGIYIPDCTSLEDLINCVELYNEKTLMCGSAAFFEQVLLHKGISKPSQDLLSKPISQDFLLISGSTHPESRRFLEQMREMDCPVYSFPESMLQEKIENNVMDEWLKKLTDSWNEKRMLALSISDKNIQFTNSSTILKQRMNYVVKKLYEKCTIKDFLIEGGATAYSLLTSLNFNSLIPDKELSPGVVRLQVSEYSDIFITIKPGSYQWPAKTLNFKAGQ
ncbi:MAG: four-carbon acid sugar kinase family protein [Paludibacter sp.]